jgi:hypothetical protein
MRRRAASAKACWDAELNAFFSSTDVTHQGAARPDGSESAVSMHRVIEDARNTGEHVGLAILAHAV